MNEDIRKLINDFSQKHEIDIVYVTLLITECLAIDAQETSRMLRGGIRKEKRDA